MKQLIINFLALYLIFSACSGNKDRSQEKEPGEVIYPVLIEVIGEEELSADRLKDICISEAISVSSVYGRKNRLIVFDTVPDKEGLKNRILSEYPDVSIKEYETPFYVFDRSRCDSGRVTGERTHVIMTANLVSDTAMQREYMQYHANQFEEWPEVSAGFCRADFQQLLIYRSGRQLMLIISIPQGEKLEELDPKTTENNPRVDEWNSIMGKYQEGIPGTAPDEKWVLFTPVQ